MKVSYKVNDSLTFEIEDKTQKDIFKQLSMVQEIFGIDKCNLCNGTKLRFIVRTIDGNDFYEMRCQNHACKGILSLSQNKVGNTLFIRLKGEDGNYLPSGGWHKYEPKPKE